MEAVAFLYGVGCIVCMVLGIFGDNLDFILMSPLWPIFYLKWAAVKVWRM